MTNERLRRAMAAAHVGVEEVSQATQVDPKTVQRWLKGRVPHARHRWTVAELVHEDERYLWPDAHPRLFELLRGKAAAGCQIRIALVDPASPQLLERDAEELLDGGLVARVRTSLHYLQEGLADCEGVELGLYASPLYNSLFRFDDEMFVTPHLYGTIGYRAPLLHLRRLGAGGVFDTFAGHFEGLWATTTPLKAAA